MLEFEVICHQEIFLHSVEAIGLSVPRKGIHIIVFSFPILLLREMVIFFFKRHLKIRETCFLDQNISHHVKYLLWQFI